MERGLEIAFQPVNGDDAKLAKALAAITANYFSDTMKVNYRIFLVELDGQHFFRILFESKELTKFHMEMRKKFMEQFDSVSKWSYEDVISYYEELLKDGRCKDIEIKRVKEEYDLWEDPIWKYI
ncbi:TVG0891770 [Thermoplasma volcanium GSS1]|uniref:TVG0891770 protein n=1 Tax=Thermoplasma volcanium (strain ATCC 51530 / DSM 4299 / JCM 9571 / NBRC 15438 / GSS1) TaxID=273116 RepID=Q97AD6_THEVO|nr:hypothetical protein [Thermoplasma volcanium]BAB60016.1 TVG0891770 [Thermoplasma volcanium GSS1]